MVDIEGWKDRAEVTVNNFRRLPVRVRTKPLFTLSLTHLWIIACLLEHRSLWIWVVSGLCRRCRSGRSIQRHERREGFWCSLGNNHSASCFSLLAIQTPHQTVQ
jgi:hypothetical protein